MFRYIKESFIVIYILLSFAVFSESYLSYFNFDKSAIQLSKNQNKLFSPNTGAEILPKDSRLVIDAIDLLKLPDFKLIGQLDDLNLEIVQRIHEGVWPIRYENGSKYLVGYKNDILLVNGIKIIYTNEYIFVGTI